MSAHSTILAECDTSTVLLDSYLYGFEYLLYVRHEMGCRGYSDTFFVLGRFIVSQELATVDKNGRCREGERVTEMSPPTSWLEAAALSRDTRSAGHRVYVLPPCDTRSHSQ